MTSLTCFKSYDVRGKVPEELNEDIAFRIGRAYAQFLKPSAVAVGYDIRLTSQQLCDSLAKGLMAGGADVINIGQCGTEEIYFAAFNEHVDGGICVTASHNPKNYNGMKFVGKDAKPISGDSGLREIQALAEANQFTDAEFEGCISYKDPQNAYLDHLLKYVDLASLPPLKIVVNAGNGGAGKVIDLLEPHLPFEFIKLNHEADGNFPNGVPNPLLVENRQATQQAVIDNKADLGIAWDGDFDRCFFFDESGEFIEGYYLVGLLAQTLLKQQPGSPIVYDPRLYWNTVEMIEQAGGKPVMSKTGHAFIKETMRREQAIYGGEMSAHHYFSSFAFCDNGTIPWLLICQLIADSKKTISQLVSERMALYPCSGEINLRVNDAATILTELSSHYQQEAKLLDHTDGLGIEFENWRFNVRMSNTEPLLRVNVEARNDKQLMDDKTQELLKLIKGLAE
ncbi:phosphomannomutase [Saccharobesus litoralis]|uniref:phosphomannomutase n=1 Tax=Saccharobesus litoralis TaxID=2172099 RepID=A0A2S0VP39_9ALTE|nr:phosphomannomutase [Saccharobesus litoralis]AWB65985.1 phosphomannomutase [Saccharobesus litoralis]